jgi:hypothetical protein
MIKDCALKTRKPHCFLENGEVCFQYDIEVLEPQRKANHTNRFLKKAAPDPDFKYRSKS